MILSRKCKLKMKPDRKADNYASALLATAKQLDCIVEADENLQQVVRLMREISVFRAFFFSTKLTPEEKSTILKTVLVNECHPVIIELVRELDAKRENVLIYKIAIAYAKLRKETLNEISVITFSVQQLNQLSIDKITALVEQSVDGRIELETVIDPDLIAGLKLRIGNRIYDGTVANKINHLKNELLQT